MTDAPDAALENDPSPSGGRRATTDDGRPPARRVVGVLTALLAFVGLGVFVAPFAFPIHPPVVQGIRSTVTFSPDGHPGGRDIARISLRMNEPGTLTISVVDPADRGGKVRAVVKNSPASTGKQVIRWNGTDASGAFLPDGRYILNIKARANKRSWSGKQRSWNSNRSMLIDTTPPKAARLGVQSVLAPGAKGACQVVATTPEAGVLTIEAVPPSANASPLAIRTPAPAAKNATTKWSWDGIAKGKPVAPGLYLIRATVADRLANGARTVATCWVAHGGGRMIPATPSRGDAVRVLLTGPDGKPVPAATRVTLSLAERHGDLGGTATNVVGDAVGGTARGPLGEVKLVLPRKRSLDGLWLIATTSNQRVIIPLRP